MGVGGEWAAGHALVAETFPPQKRGRAGALLQTGAPIGVGLAALVGTFLVPVVGWRAVLIGSSATAVLAFIARRHMPESDVWLTQKTRRLGEGISRLVSGDLAPRFYLALLLTTVNGASYWLTYSWMPEYLRSRGLGLVASGLYLGRDGGRRDPRLRRLRFRLRSHRPAAGVHPVRAHHGRGPDAAHRLVERSSPARRR